MLGEDRGRWQRWWRLHRDAYLDLRQTRGSEALITGSDEIFLGVSRRHQAPPPTRPSAVQVEEQIVPRLLARLQRSHDTQTARACLLALAQIRSGPQGTRVLRTIENYLKAADPALREAAALALGITGRGEATMMLRAIAADTALGRRLCGERQVGYRTRAMACYGLGLTAWHSEEGRTKARVQEALSAVLDLEDTPHGDLQVAAIVGLGMLRPDPEAGHRGLRAAALRSLDRILQRGTDRRSELLQAHIAPAIARLLGRGDSGLHQHFKERFRVLLQQRDERGNHLLRGAALALGELCLAPEQSPGDQPFVASLSRYLAAGRDLATRSFCCVALGQIGGAEARRALLKQLSRGNKALERPWAALGLGLLEHARRSAAHPGPADPLIGRALLGQLEGVKNPEARAAFAIALGLCGYRPAAPRMLELLERYRSQDELAGSLCLGLGMLGHKPAVASLRETLAHARHRPGLFLDAALALHRLGERNLVVHIGDHLRRGPQNQARSAILLRSLAKVGDRRIVSALLEFLADDQRTLASRAAAAAALGRIADRAALPWSCAITQALNYRAEVETLRGPGYGVLAGL